MLTEFYRDRLRTDFPAVFIRWKKALPEDPGGLQLVKLFLGSPHFNPKQLTDRFQKFVDRTLPSESFATGPKLRRLVGFHAHLYALPGEAALSQGALERTARRQLAAHSVAIFGWNSQPLGPHARDNLEFRFGSAALDTVMAFAAQYGEGRSILIHSVTGDDLYEHTLGGIWWGEQLPLDFGALDIRRAMAQAPALHETARQV